MLPRNPEAHRPLSPDPPLDMGPWPDRGGPPGGGAMAARPLVFLRCDLGKRVER